MVFIKALTVLFFAACALAQSMDKIAYTECKHPGSGKLLEVRISNCTDLPCVFKRGERTTIEMDFIPTYDVAKVFTGAKARIGEKKLRFTGIDRTPACDNIFVKETGDDIEDCKLTAGTAYTYSYELDILDRYPIAKAQVQWKLSEVGNGHRRRKHIVCFQVPAIITAA